MAMFAYDVNGVFYLFYHPSSLCCHVLLVYSHSCELVQFFCKHTHAHTYSRSSIHFVLSLPLWISASSSQRKCQSARWITRMFSSLDNTRTSAQHELWSAHVTRVQSRVTLVYCPAITSSHHLSPLVLLSIPRPITTMKTAAAATRSHFFIETSRSLASQGPAWTRSSLRLCPSRPSLPPSLCCFLCVNLGWESKHTEWPWFTQIISWQMGRCSSRAQIKRE